MRDEIFRAKFTALIESLPGTPPDLGPRVLAAFRRETVLRNKEWEARAAREVLALAFGFLPPLFARLIIPYLGIRKTLTLTELVPWLRPMEQVKALLLWFLNLKREVGTNV